MEPYKVKEIVATLQANNVVIVGVGQPAVIVNPFGLFGRNYDVGMC